MFEVDVAEYDVGLPRNAVFVQTTTAGTCGDDINIYTGDSNGWLIIGAFCGGYIQVLDTKTAGVNDLFLTGRGGGGHAFTWDGHSWGGSIRCPPTGVIPGVRWRCYNSN